MNIAIIGAGPIGCYCGYLLAKSGHQVDIYEEHQEIGLPIQCTGLLTSDFDQFNLEKETFLVNTFDSVEINSPRRKVIIPQKEYLICRHKFDNYLASLAKNSGANFYTAHAFIGKENITENPKKKKNKKNKLIIRNNKLNRNITIYPEIVIAADGPLSKTAKSFDLYHQDRTNYYGIQAIVEDKFNKNQYQTYFGNSICPDLFGWIVPESKIRARVGLASKNNANKLFDNFINLMIAKHQFKIIEIQAGLIPLYSKNQKLNKDNCYLLGDASGFVKATTLGGIVPGMKQAEILAECLNKGKDYEKECKKLKRKLNLHLRLRKTFNKFSDSDWDKLIGLFAQDKIQNVFIKHTRDNPFPLIFKSIIREPRLLMFVKYFF